MSDRQPVLKPSPSTLRRTLAVAGLAVVSAAALVALQPVVPEAYAAAAAAAQAEAPTVPQASAMQSRL